MGLEDVYFTTETAKDATNFLITRTALLRHIGTQSYRGVAIASKVLEIMVAPVFLKPNWLTRPTFEAGINNAMKDVIMAE